jgi:hypothetical protein
VYTDLSDFFSYLVRLRTPVCPDKQGVLLVGGGGGQPRRVPAEAAMLAVKVMFSYHSTDANVVGRIR